MQRFHPGHKFTAKERTTDVWTEEQVDFESLLLSPLILKGLTDSGFEKPSPIQLKAIPLGRCGLDLIAQAKSGTGKTCVFSVIALENVLLENPAPQVLILAPTREIAVQIKDVVNAIGCHLKGLSCQVFIGGLPVDEDKKALKGCQIAAGSPGRIKNLIENKHLKTDSIRMFILDEADKLLDENFQEQINWIFSTLPANKQMMAFSATYPEYLATHLTRYMREPTFVRLNASDPTLQGIKQFYHVVPFHQLPHKIFQEKVEHLLKLLSKVNFHQCLLFSNFQIRAQSLSSTLCAKGWPATFIAGSQTQEKRLQAMEKLKAFKCRILISTDLTARGIDAENVNLVVNMDVPRDGETYLHRIGRAGRFGTKGVAVTFVAKGKEEEKFKEIEKSIGVTMEVLPDHIPDSLMISNSLSGAGQVQVRQDRIEVNVLHKSTTAKGNSKESARSFCSNGEGNVTNGLKEQENHYKQKKVELDSNYKEDTPIHENGNWSPTSHKSNGTVGYQNEATDKHIKQSIKYSLNKSGLSVKQEKSAELPSQEEFEKDFEEYLALASTFENIGLQDNSESCHGNQTTVAMDNLVGECSNQIKDDNKHHDECDEVDDGGSDDGKLTTDVTRKLVEIVHASEGANGDVDDGVDDKDENIEDNTDSDDDDDDMDDTSSGNEGDSDDDRDEEDGDDDDESEDGTNDETDQSSKGGHIKNQSHFSNVIFKTSKDKNYNDTAAVVEGNSESDQQPSGDDDDDENIADDDVYESDDIVESDENDNALADDIDDDDDDDDVDDDASGGDSDYEDTADSNDGDNEEDCDTNDNNCEDLSHLECKSSTLYNSNKTSYWEKTYGVSQGIELPSVQHHGQSSTPEYYWNSCNYPDNYYYRNSMGYNPGTSPWQQDMSGIPRLAANQATSVRPEMSGLPNHNRTPEQCLSHLGSQHLMMDTGNMEHYPSDLGGQGYSGVQSPMYADHSSIQSRDTSWSKAWHNAYYQINNAIQQYAAMNATI